MGKWKSKSSGARGGTSRPAWEVGIEEAPGPERAFALYAANTDAVIVFSTTGSSLTQVIRALADEIAARKPAPGVVYMEEPADAKIASRYLPASTRVELVEDLPLLSEALAADDDLFGDAPPLPPLPGFPDADAPAWIPRLRRLLEQDPWGRLPLGQALVFDDPRIPGMALAFPVDDDSPSLGLYASEADLRWLAEESDDDLEEDGTGDDQGPRVVALMFHPASAIDEDDRADLQELGLVLLGDLVPAAAAVEGMTPVAANAADLDALLVAIELTAALLEQNPELPAEGDVEITTPHGASRVRLVLQERPAMALEDFGATADVLTLGAAWNAATQGATPALVLFAMDEEGEEQALVREVELLDALTVHRCQSCGEIDLRGWADQQFIFDLWEHGQPVDERLLDGDTLLVVVLPDGADPATVSPEEALLTRTLPLSRLAEGIVD